MTDTHAQAHNYFTGDLRPHHILHINDGNIVIQVILSVHKVMELIVWNQVENAIFKIHRSLLERYSTAIKDILDATDKGGSKDGTDASPLVLAGDNAAGWELLLGLQYDM